MRVTLKDSYIILSVGVAIGLSLFFLSYGRLGISAIQWGGNDFIEYRTLAQNVLQGHGFSLRNAEPFLPSAMRTPGYPLFLAFSLLLTGGTVLASLLQIVLFSLFGVLSYLILREIEIDRKFAFIASLLVLIEPDIASMGIYLISDTLANVLLFASFYGFLRAYKLQRVPYLFISSFVLGLSALVRPVSLAVWGIYFFAWCFTQGKPIFSKSKIYTILISFLLVIMPLLPWVIRNYVAFGVPKVSSGDTYNLYTVIVPQIVSYRDGISYAEARDNLLTEFLNDEELAPLPNPKNIGHKVHQAELLMLDDFTYQPWMRSKFTESMADNMRYYGEAIFKGTIEYFTQVNWLTPLEHWDLLHPSYRPSVSFIDAFHEDGFRGLFEELYRRFACGTDCVLSFGLQFLGRVLWALLIPLAALGFIIWYKRYSYLWPFAFSVFSFVMIIAAVHIFFTGALVQPRYRIPVAPFIICYALVAVHAFGRQLMSKVRMYGKDSLKVD